MKTNTYTLAVIGFALLAIAAILMFKPFNNVLGSAFTGQAAYLQTATTTSVGNQAVPPVTIAQANADCKARVVSTREMGVMVSFGDTTGFGSTTLSATAGHWQGPSTTVAYDSGLYGCGRMTAYAVASTTLTVSQF